MPGKREGCRKGYTDKLSGKRKDSREIVECCKEESTRGRHETHGEERGIHVVEKVCCGKVMAGKLSMNAMFKPMDKMNARVKEVGQGKEIAGEEDC